MKKSKYYLSYVLLSVFVAFPAVVVAQASNVASSSNSQLYPDGSGESRSERRERILGYWHEASDLDQKISALGSTASYPMYMPVLFGVGVKDIFPNFGDPRSGGRTHEGEDIMALKGVPIVSPTSAVVIRTGVGTGEGNYVYTANPGGETFVYMHLDRIGEGVVSGLVLAQGSLIGYVGNTGNASGGAAHLHFEVHNSSGVPMAPFPRLTLEFTLQEKISYLSAILNQTTDNIALSRFLVSNFRSTFIAAQSANIILPSPVIDALGFIPANSAPASAGSFLPAGDLDIGSSGADVVALQKYLIQSASGVAATRLAEAGATGYFGTITKAALLEYQLAVGISPANGYYGLTTRTFIASRQAGTPTPTPAPAGNSSALRDGDLARAVGSSDVYIIKFVGPKQFKRLILSPSVFNSYGHLRWENIKEVEVHILNAILTSDLVRAIGDPRVFKLYPSGDTGQKSWIKTAGAFLRLGYDWDSIYEINATDRNSYIEIGVIE